MEKTSYPGPKKRLGQHFLYDKRVIRKIIARADLVDGENVLEIGPGRGHMTSVLADLDVNLIAVEIDTDLVRGPLSEVSAVRKFEIINKDVLELDLSTIFGSGEDYKLISNLTYTVGGRILRKFLSGTCPPSLSVVMLQREVAENIISASGKLGIMGAFLGAFVESSILFTVKPSSFRPPPKVMSSVLRLSRLDRPLISPGKACKYFQFIISGFSSPRKQIRNSLAHGLKLAPSEVDKMLTDSNIDSVRRPETISVLEWIRLFDLVSTRKDSSLI